jgi:hypothetical protein
MATKRRKGETMDTQDAIDLLQAAPPEAGVPADSDAEFPIFHRVAKVRMSWNPFRQQWEWEKPEGISTYREIATNDPRSATTA